MLGLNPADLPRAVLYLAENQLYGFGGYMVLNVVAQKLVATGAYEVFLGSERIFSALEQGGVPSVDYISELLTARGLKPVQTSQIRQSQRGR